MSSNHNCQDCASGCTARHTDENAVEEIKAAPYLIFAGTIVVLASILYRWFFVG